MSDLLQNMENDFGEFGGRIWMNCAHQGPLPRVAVSAALQAIQEKTSPHLISNDAFDEVPSQLRSVLGTLIDCPADEIILGNSASYGLHLLANGIHWQAGDEILLVRDDFPANVLPWLMLRDAGVVVRFVSPGKPGRLQPEDLEQHISTATRLVCVSWVDSYTGWQLDLREIGNVCRKRGALLVVNVSQGLGARALDRISAPVDAIVCCGYKWLCGPYGTGFCWVNSELLKSMRCNQNYWWPVRKWATDSNFESDPPIVSSRQFDVFCTANFLNSLPWIAAIEYLLKIGLARIAAHNACLVRRLLDGINRDTYRLISPDTQDGPSTMVVLCHRRPDVNPRVFDMLRDQGVDIAMRRKNLRLSPHLFNTEEQIDLAIRVLNSVG